MSNSAETRPRGRILFQLSGSIACYKSCQAISRLVQDGFEVRTVASAGALRFVGAATLEGLTGNPVFTDAFEPGRMMDHIHLAKWADVTILAPASATTLNRLAAGAGSDVLTTLFLAHDLAEKPYLAAPAMNVNMWRHPATRESVEKLTRWGVRVLPTGEGRQACGDIGEGRLIEPDELVQAIVEAAPKGGRA